MKQLNILQVKHNFDNDTITIIWNDGSETIVKKCENDINDFEKALLYAYINKLNNNITTKTKIQKSIIKFTKFLNLSKKLYDRLRENKINYEKRIQKDTIKKICGVLNKDLEQRLYDELIKNKDE